MSLLLRWNENDRQKSDRCGDENVREAREREEGGGALLYYKTPSSNAGVSNECRPTTLRTSTPPKSFVTTKRVWRAERIQTRQCSVWYVFSFVGCTLGGSRGDGSGGRLMGASSCLEPSSSSSLVVPCRKKDRGH